MDTWSLVAHPDVREWLYEICKADRATATMTVRAIQRVLSGAGPEEPRPLVERIKGSRVRELRELRPATAGHTEVKLLFAFVEACETNRNHGVEACETNQHHGVEACETNRNHGVEACETNQHHGRGGGMVLLVAGENPGTWAKWYRDAVPLAERRYQEFQEGNET